MSRPSPTNVVIRDARPDDAAAIGRARVAGWRSRYRGVLPAAVLDTLDPAEQAPMWRERITNRHRLGEAFAVAEAAAPEAGAPEASPPGATRRDASMGEAGTGETGAGEATRREARTREAGTGEFAARDAGAGGVIGFAASGPLRAVEGVATGDLPERAGELYALYVLPAWQGTGTGRALLHRCGEQLDALGRTDHFLWTLAANTHAQRFYEAQGWEADGAVKVTDYVGTLVRSLRYHRVR